MLKGLMTLSNSRRGPNETAELLGRMETCDQKLPKIEASPPSVNHMSLELTVAQAIGKLTNTIEAQSKSVVKQIRILLLPEQGARNIIGLFSGESCSG